MKIAAYHSPAIMKSLPEMSAERTQTILSLRVFWHRIFDPCPTLESSALDARELFESFMDDEYESGRPYDWTLHLRLLDWLRSQKKHLSLATNKEIQLEMAAAAAYSWCTSDLSNSLCLLLQLKGWRETAIHAVKYKSIFSAPTCVLVELEQTILAKSHQFKIASNKKELLAATWQRLPED